MNGPLKTVIRNLSDRLLSYSVIPTLYIQPRGEQELQFDPFSVWRDFNAMETLLLDVRRGVAQIIFCYDATYAMAAPINDHVHLSRAGERTLETLIGAPEVKANEDVIEAIPVKEAVPVGKTAEDAGHKVRGDKPLIPEVNLDKTAETLQKNTVELTLEHDKSVDEKAVSETTRITEIQEPAEAKAAPKVSAKKPTAKKVVTL